MHTAADILALACALAIVGFAASAITFAVQGRARAWMASLGGVAVSAVVLAELQYDGRGTWAFYAFILPTLAVAVGLGSLLAAAIGRYRRNRNSQA